MKKTSGPVIWLEFSKNNPADIIESVQKQTIVSCCKSDRVKIESFEKDNSYFLRIGFITYNEDLYHQFTIDPQGWSSIHFRARPEHFFASEKGYNIGDYWIGKGLCLTNDEEFQPLCDDYKIQIFYDGDVYWVAFKR